ncbi:MAG: carbohydrate binding domain-containing protein [Woeseiaceae bacterium]|nr:carbohydrate binding domain-containing protein [Woeseiaceae bacterium]
MTYDFGPDAGFGGGVALVVDNSERTGINLSLQTAQMQKFAAEPFGGATLNLGDNVDFSKGEAFRMKVWASRNVPVTFKFEDAISGLPQNGKERVLNHTGSDAWEELCFNFGGDTAGFTTNSITFIFDNGVVGDAGSSPGNWTFLFDDIEQIDSCPEVFPIDFEADPSTYNFGPDGGFGGGASDVIPNPDRDNAVNPTAQTARMQKFASETFGGSALQLPGNVDFTKGSAFKMKVWSRRSVPVLFKLEGPSGPDSGRERSQTHPGGSVWQELCYDFTGATAGFSSSALTFIFDLGILGNADNDPDNWTFYYDEIEQVESCTAVGTPPAAFETITFDDPAVSYTLTGFGGAEDSSVQPDPDDATNNVARVIRSESAQTFAGTVVSTAPNESSGVIPLDATETQMNMRVRVPAAGIPVRLKIENSDDDTISVETEVTATAADTWQNLTFDFTNQVGGTTAFDPAATYDKLIVFFNFGTDGATVGAQTFYFDDIAVGAGAPISGAPPIDFESGSATFNDFEGGVATVIDNPAPGGINTSSKVAQMQKFAGEPFAGSTLDLGGPVDLAAGDSYLMKVLARRAVDVTLKLEPQADERVASYSGSGAWEELCFDFSGVSGTVTGLTVIFDNGTVGDATNDPDNWTFQFDDIRQTSDPCPTPPQPPAFSTITFDDPGTTYTLADFNGNTSTITNDPAGGTNMVASTVRSASAQATAGTTVSTLPGNQVPELPLTASSTEMSVRVWSPAAGITVRLKIEDALNSAVFVETDTATTVANDWETLTFDFANAASQAFDEANTYNRISIFFNFGVDGATAGEQVYYFDDVAVGPGSGSPGTGITPDAVIYATDPAVTEDLAPPAIENFGSGAVFDANFAADPVFNPAFSITSGDDYDPGVVDVGFVAFTGYTAGFASTYGTIDFKVKDLPNDSIEVKMFGANRDTSVVYNVTSYQGSTDLGDGWYQVSVPTAYYQNIDVNDGLLLGPFGDQGAPFSFLLTDIGFSGAFTGNGGEYAINGGFEDGDLTGWAVFPNGGSVAVDGMEASSGSFSMHVVVGPGQNPVIKQEFRANGIVTGGQAVNVSFDMKGSAAVGGVINAELISEDGSGATGEILEVISTPTADWTTYSYTPTAATNVASGLTLQIVVVCGSDPSCSADVFIDNVSITLQ